MIQDKLLQVADADPNPAVALFVENIAVLPLKSVVAQLSSKPELLLAYLSEMFGSRRDEYDVDGMAEYHNLQVQLHVRYKVAGLLEFLEQSHVYDLDLALRECASHKPHPLHREMVFLFRRQGNFS
jgi:hypothetical protein